MKVPAKWYIENDVSKYMDIPIILLKFGLEKLYKATFGSANVADVFLQLP